MIFFNSFNLNYTCEGSIFLIQLSVSNYKFLLFTIINWTQIRERKLVEKLEY